MKQTRLLFIDRDGTLIQEPEDEQIDSFEKLVFTKGVFRNLAFIAQHTDYELVMVSTTDSSSYLSCSWLIVSRMLNISRSTCLKSYIFHRR